MTKTLLSTCSRLSEAERLVDAFTSQASQLQTSQLNFCHQLEAALSRLQVEYVRPPSWVYILEATPENHYKVWRVESSQTLESESGAGSSEVHP